jgi:DNA-binding NtrC family response regulator
MFRLVISCDDRVRRVPLTGATSTIGAAADNDVVVACVGVSRHHATLTRSGDTLVVRDVGSRNGLLVQGRRLDRIELSPGDGVQLGRAFVQLERISTSDADLALRIGRQSSTHEPPGKTESRADLTGSEAARAMQWLREAEDAEDGIGGGRRRELLSRARGIVHADAIVLCRLTRQGDLAFEEIDGELPSESAAAELAAMMRDPGDVLPLTAITRTGWTVVPLGSGRAMAVQSSVGSSRIDWHPFIEFVALRLFADRRRERKASSGIVNLIFPDRYIPGTSAAMRRLHEQLLGASRTRAHVLLRGENGTGKEFVAEILHASGSTAKGPFRAINCAAIPAELLEAELFGVRHRVATGVDPRPGLFIEANHGTVFLDEIGDLPLTLQPKLLRVLQEREVQPLGTSKPVKIDVRIIASTNRDLEQMLREHRFRDDLYYRLRGLEFTVPPLRERREDIPAIATELLSRIAESHHKRIEGVSRKALAQLTSYHWPGNVREMENVLERAISRCPSGGTLEAKHFDDLSAAPATPAPSSLQSNLATTERETILSALRRTDGNKSEAARLLGITRAGLYLKLKRHKID